MYFLSTANSPPATSCYATNCVDNPANMSYYEMRFRSRLSLFADEGMVPTAVLEDSSAGHAATSDCRNIGRPGAPTTKLACSRHNALLTPCESTCCVPTVSFGWRGPCCKTELALISFLDDLRDESNTQAKKVKFVILSDDDVMYDVPGLLAYLGLLDHTVPMTVAQNGGVKLQKLSWRKHHTKLENCERHPAFMSASFMNPFIITVPALRLLEPSLRAGGLRLQAEAHRATHDFMLGQFMWLHGIPHHNCWRLCVATPWSSIAIDPRQRIKGSGRDPSAVDIVRHPVKDPGSFQDVLDIFKHRMFGETTTSETLLSRLKMCLDNSPTAASLMVLQGYSFTSHAAKNNHRLVDPSTGQWNLFRPEDCQLPLGGTSHAHCTSREDCRNGILESTGFTASALSAMTTRQVLGAHDEARGEKASATNARDVHDPPSLSNANANDESAPEHFSLAPRFEGTPPSMQELEGEIVEDAAQRSKPCRHFLGRNGSLVGRGRTQCGLEWTEWLLVAALVPSGATVLELGARFGTTSCMLSRKTGNSARSVVAVEPDPTVWSALEQNRRNNRCNFNIIRGSVGVKPMYLEFLGGDQSKKGLHSGSSYTTHTKEAATRHGAMRATDFPVPRHNYHDIERHIGRKFDTLLIDCEGCVESFLKDQEEILDGIKLILIEEDRPMSSSEMQGSSGKRRNANRKVDYGSVHGIFQRHGFERIWQVQDTGPSGDRHSAWQRGGLVEGKQVTCASYARQMGYGKSDLICLDP